MLRFEQHGKEHPCCPKSPRPKSGGENTGFREIRGSSDGDRMFGDWFQDGGGENDDYVFEVLRRQLYFFVRGIKKNHRTLVSNQMSSCLAIGDVSWPPFEERRSRVDKMARSVTEYIFSPFLPLVLLAVRDAWDCHSPFHATSMTHIARSFFDACLAQGQQVSLHLCDFILVHCDDKGSSLRLSL